jgi:hypothetical protein
MKYALLIYLDEKQFTALPKEEQNRVHQECGAWHEELVKSGHSVGCKGLQGTASATTLRERDGKVAIMDGPFAETKEMLGGLETLECRDLDEALGIAKRFPGLRGGRCAVEVRPEVTGGTCEA